MKNNIVKYPRIFNKHIKTFWNGAYCSCNSQEGVDRLARCVVTGFVIGTELGNGEVSVRGMFIQFRSFGARVPWTNIVSFARQNAEVVPVTSQETKAVLLYIRKYSWSKHANSLIMLVYIDYLHRFRCWYRSDTLSRDTALVSWHDIWTSHQVCSGVLILIWC